MLCLICLVFSAFLSVSTITFHTSLKYVVFSFSDLDHSIISAISHKIKLRCKQLIQYLPKISGDTYSLHQHWAHLVALLSTLRCQWCWFPISSDWLYLLRTTHQFALIKSTKSSIDQWSFYLFLWFVYNHQTKLWQARWNREQQFW